MLNNNVQNLFSFIEIWLALKDVRFYNNLLISVNFSIYFRKKKMKTKNEITVQYNWNNIITFHYQLLHKNLLHDKQYYQYLLGNYY